MMRKMRVTWTSDEDSLVSTVIAGCVIDLYYSFVSHFVCLVLSMSDPLLFTYSLLLLLD